MSRIHVASRHMDAIKVGRLEAVYSSDGYRILRYTIDFLHKKLDLHKTLSAPELVVLQNKVDALIALWDKKYEAYLERSQVRSEKEFAEQASIDAQNSLNELNTILKRGLESCAAIDWEQLKDKSRFEKQLYIPPPPSRWPAEPAPTYVEPHISLWDRILGRASGILADAQGAHQDLVKKWRINAEQKEAHFLELDEEWKRQTAKSEAEFLQEERQFYAEQDAANSKIEALAQDVAEGRPEGVIEHVTLVLDRSDYGELFEKSFELEFISAERTLLIAYQLPSPDSMPKLKSVRFVKATGELKPTYISERERQTNFDSACYQICLRTLYEVFDADICRNISRILFNGMTSYVDRSTGKDVTACIMSVLVDREHFSQIDLSRIDPKACFKSLKGVSASTLSALAPIAPILQLNRSDRRFVDARDTLNAVDSATNLAAMDWEDFEHLVRGVFEKEFAARGGEVRITQSSSDGGVDAVAFDPDPITGGKIVIQAKRYTKTVGVSAVRDLYGTMQHESASRGILVTTADFGPDAHRFSTGKPITLMTGANLLHLLGKHGINAKIDLREARKALNLKS